MASDGKRRLFGWLWRLMRLLAVIAAVSGVIFWFKFSAVPVIRQPVESGEIVAEVMGTGTVEARLKSTVSPKIAGRLQNLLVDQGDRVAQGQVLFTLDDVELTQQVEIARATVDSSHAAIDRLEADRAQAIAVLDQAQRRSDRVARLLESSALSEEEMDKATEALLIAEAGIARTAAALAEAQKELSVAEKTLAYHAARLADTQIAAPFDGLIVRRMRDPGDIVVPGSPTLTLIATEEIWITAWVDETEMARLQVGQAARVIFRSESNRSYQGTVARLGREADRETREFVVDVHVLALPENWAVGQRAEVYIETDRRQAAAIVPARFIHWKDEQPGVYRLAQQRALWQAVQLGLRDRERVEVIEGLEAGDVVLLAASVRSALTERRRVASP